MLGRLITLCVALFLIPSATALPVGEENLIGEAVCSLYKCASPTECDLPNGAFTDERIGTVLACLPEE